MVALTFTLFQIFWTKCVNVGAMSCPGTKDKKQPFTNNAHRLICGCCRCFSPAFLYVHVKKDHGTFAALSRGGSTVKDQPEKLVFHIHHKINSYIFTSCVQSSSLSEMCMVVIWRIAQNTCCPQTAACGENEINLRKVDMLLNKVIVNKYLFVFWYWTWH